MKKLFTILLAAMMVVGLAAPVFAAPAATEVTVTYDANGGTGSMASVTVTVPANSDNEMYELLPNAFTAPGSKVFLGWGETASATQFVDRLVINDTDTTRTVYAIWGDAPVSDTATNPNLTTTGSIIINNSVNGETYSAYRLFELYSFKDVNVDAEAHDNEQYSYYIESTHPLYTWLSNYEFASGKKAFTFDTAAAITVGSKTYYPVKAHDDFHAATGRDEDIENEYQASGAVIQKFAMDTLAKINELNTATPGTVAAAGTANGNGSAATISGLPLGYYLVDSTLGSLCALDTTNSNVTIVEKNELSVVAKTVMEDSKASDAYGDKNDADIGQTVEYQSTVTIPLRESNVVYHDKMAAGLTLDPASIRVTGTDVNGHYTIYDGTTGHEIPAAYTNGEDFVIEFDTAWTESLTAPVSVVITYNATLNADAIVGEQTGLAMGAGNDNEAWVTFGQAQSTEHDWTRTYTWSYEIFKYAPDSSNTTAAKTAYADAHAAALAGYVKNADASATDANYWIKATPLAGATFNLKQGGTPIQFVLKTAGTATTPAVYRHAVAGDASPSADLVTPASGLILVEGIDADTYSLEETAAPAGYNKLAAEVAVVIDSNTDTAQGNDNTKQPDITVATTQDGTQVAEVTIENLSGIEMPSTGGIGTTIFYIVGGIIVAAAIVLLITKKRVSKD